jgi:diadenosine tetraphosphate (Ap4A) HIT family hydrolase
MDETVILETGHFRAEHCRDCGVAGYVIVSPRQQAPSLAAMEPEALAELGAVLARATAAIEAALSPERVYCALFGEEARDVHFHLFPRTAALLDEYCSSTGATAAGCSGPLLLDWARERFRRGDTEAPLDAACRSAILSMRRWIEEKAADLADHGEGQ